MGVPGVLLMIDPVLFQLGPFAVRWYGLCMALSVGVGFYYLLNGGRRLGYDDDFLYNLAFFVVLSGIVGARAVYVATNWSIYAQEPWAIWRIDLGGLSFHGAVIGGILGAWPYLRHHGASFSALADHAVPGLAFGIAIVRWANLINQEAMGRVTAQGFSHPTQIYGSVIGVVLLAVNAYLSRRQPPIMRAIVPTRERQITMDQLRPVSRTERIIFPIMVTVVGSLLVPSATTLLGSLMLGNLLRESKIVERLSQTAQNELINIVTIFLGVSVGATARGVTFLTPYTLGIIALGLIAFAGGTAGGLLFGRLMCAMSRGRINPLIGAAGVSAVPMAARVVQKVGQEENPENFLLMHAMGPNVSGVIGSAIAAGVFLAVLG
jgi:hypothetical protein